MGWQFKLTVAILLVLSACAGPESSLGSRAGRHILLSDSSGVMDSQTGTMILSGDDLRYDLPDTIFSVYYQLAHYKPQSYQKAVNRKLSFLVSSPDDSSFAVVSGHPGVTDVIFYSMSLNDWFLINWSAHTKPIGLFWSPDSRFLLIGIEGGGGRSLVLYELTLASNQPVVVQQRWSEKDRGYSWPTNIQPRWKMSESRVEIDCWRHDNGDTTFSDTTIQLRW